MDALDRDVVSSKYFAVALFSMDAKTPVRKSISNDDDMMVLQETCMEICSGFRQSLSLRRSTHHEVQYGSVVNLYYMYETR